MEAVVLVGLILAFGIGAVVLMRGGSSEERPPRIGDGLNRCLRCDNFLGVIPTKVCLRCGHRA